MIIQREHPTSPGTPVYIPLCFDFEQGTWRPIPGSLPFYPDRSEAMACCAQHLHGLWKGLAHDMAVVRAMSEHPNFELHADGINDAMIRTAARRATDRALFVEEHLERLLDAPGDRDQVDLTVPSAPGTSPGEAAPRSGDGVDLAMSDDPG